MLSISTLSGSGAGLGAYFEKEAGQADYWAKEAHESTQWIGKGAAELGLAGAVQQEQFENIMDRILPDGTQLPGGQGGKRRMGYDLTFSAPKSVSLQALVGDDSRIIQAHEEAVRSALKHIEKDVLTAQAKLNGVIRHEQPGRMVAAVFKHETSRELDPQLHSHSVVANMTKTGDGRWRALDGAQFYRAKMAAGAMYRAELAGRLQNLGYKLEMTNARQGLFELKGYKPEQLKSFSTRRTQIESALEKSGHGKSAKAAEVAALGTRKGKQVLQQPERDALKVQWKERAKAAGIRMTKPNQPRLMVGAGQRDAARQAVRSAAAGLAKSGKPFTREKLLGRAMARSVGLAKPEQVQKALQQAIKTGQVKQLKNGQFKATSKLRPGFVTRQVRGAVGRALLPGPLRALRAITKSVNRTAEQNQSRGMSR